jgi:pimeloyl-ACP methyl ester carboxylesterase
MYTFDYQGHTLTWEEYGDSNSDHALVFIHGWSVGRLSWEPIIPPFTRFGRCIAIDLPGHFPAQTPPNFISMTQEELLDIEAQAITHICGDQPITLIGHSAGGLVALGLAAQLGTQIKQVVAVNSVVWGDFTGIVGTAQWLVRHGMYPAFETLWNITLLNTPSMMLGLSFFVHQQPDFWTRDLSWDSCRLASTWYRQHSLADLTVFLKMLEASDIRPLIANLNTPTLVVVGEKDPVVPPEQSYWLVDHLPHAELRLLEETGHIPQVEAPTSFRQVLVDWLNEHR